MAVNPTGAIFKTLEFDGVSSRTYGIYITGDAVYDAPARDVEMVTIPGRNGAFAQDNGRFENITVTYPAGIYADTEEDYAEAVSEFRNFLCSRRGYCRLEDDYNPDEYRMAIYKSGLEVDTKQLKAGQFSIEFECKPQRFLKAGEGAVEVESGETLTNPTRFNSSPLLEIEGYGEIGFNGYNINIENTLVGRVGLLPAVVDYDNSRESNRKFSDSLVNLIDDGDTLTLPSFILTTTITPTSYSNINKLVVTGISYSGGHNIPNYVGYESGTPASDLRPVRIFNYGQQDFVKGTQDANGYISYVDTVVFNVEARKTSDSSIVSGTITGSLHSWVRLRENSNFLSIAFAANPTISSPLSVLLSKVSLKTTLTAPEFYAISTQSILGQPTYIDCDLGEAYKIIDGTPSSLNGSIDLGSQLPELLPGSNEFIYDNTITSLAVHPRWWKI